MAPAVFSWLCSSNTAFLGGITWAWSCHYEASSSNIPAALVETKRVASKFLPVGGCQLGLETLV